MHREDRPSAVLFSTDACTFGEFLFVTHSNGFDLTPNETLNVRSFFIQ